MWEKDNIGNRIDWSMVDELLRLLRGESFQPLKPHFRVKMVVSGSRWGDDDDGAYESSPSCVYACAFAIEAYV